MNYMVQVKRQLCMETIRMYYVAAGCCVGLNVPHMAGKFTKQQAQEIAKREHGTVVQA